MSTRCGDRSRYVAQCPDFDEVIDVRSEGEFADDHIPSLSICPVLDNDERARVGRCTSKAPRSMRRKSAHRSSLRISHAICVYVSGSAAHLAAARVLLARLRTQRRIAHLFSQVGWKVARLDGGYNAIAAQVYRT